MGKLATICSYFVRLVLALIAIFLGSAILFQWNNPKHSILISNPHGNDLAPNFRGEKGEYFKNKENLWIHYDEYLPNRDSKNAKGLLLWLHGLETYAGLYADAAQKVADATNLIVLTQDHQGNEPYFVIKNSGWGLSEGDRSVSDLQADFHQLLALKKKEYNMTKNVFCFGHSFSAGLLVWDHFNSLQAGQPSLCQGLVLSGLGVSLDPALESLLDGPFGQTLNYLCGIFPKMIFLKLIGVAEVASGLPEFHEAWNKDPLIHAFIRVRTGLNFMKIMQDNTKYQINKLSLPFFVFTGSQDQMVQPETLKQFVELAESKDKTVKIYQGDAHSVIHDKHGHEAIEDISNWLEQHIK